MNIINNFSISHILLEQTKKNLKYSNFIYNDVNIEMNSLVKLCSILYLNIVITILLIILLPFNWRYTVSFAIIVQTLIPLLVTSIYYRKEINNLI